MKYLLCLLFIPLLYGAPKPQTRSAQPGVKSGNFSFEHGNLTRRYYLHLPTVNSAPSPLPLVIALHGGPGTGDSLRLNTGLVEKANQENFAVVFPEGAEFRENFQSWNTGYCCDIPSRIKIDDVGFIRRLIARLVSKHVADPERVFIVGFSKGAIMAHRLACEAADVISGIADVSGALDYDACNPTRPVHVIMFHGKADRNVLYSDAEARLKKIKPANNWPDRSVAYAVDFWTKINACNAPRTETQGPAEILNFTCTGAQFRLVSFENEGHTWPGAKPAIPGADLPTPDFSATDAIWQFFDEATTTK